MIEQKVEEKGIAEKSLVFCLSWLQMQHPSLLGNVRKITLSSSP